MGYSYVKKTYTGQNGHLAHKSKVKNWRSYILPNFVNFDSIFTN